MIGPQRETKWRYTWHDTAPRISPKLCLYVDPGPGFNDNLIPIRSHDLTAVTIMEQELGTPVRLQDNPERWN
ncbi:hypothetical protein PsorP6_010644 [Peronosclerospora sorghi]|uniref:Uncharacterized protein n=1 Tax=Peronosclerospora sorghi TaxID=230839 RepID=A0ACC0VTK3_9STRA|nr:hypothetical protein PsorP6_010644 [Peronosclerospora sorghi]